MIIGFILGLGGGEVVLILLVFIMFFGAKSIPGIARGLGKGIREFKNATGAIQREINQSINDAERQAMDLGDTIQKPLNTIENKPDENSLNK
ncbi:MAG: twin-arginine translocase TatA/TatE family subunit [Bacteroidia bacterium]